MTQWTARKSHVNSILSVGISKKHIQSRLQEDQNQTQQIRLSQDFITLHPPTTVLRSVNIEYSCITATELPVPFACVSLNL
jgi:hypothetical protein